MKILHVIASLATRYGGPSQACIEMAKAVSNRGHEVDVYTTNIDGEGELKVPLNDRIEEKGVGIYYFPVQFPRIWRKSSELGRALGNNISKYDIVHSHSLYLYHNYKVYKECTKQNVPYIVRPHGTLDPYMYNRHRWRKKLLEVCFQNNAIRHAAAIHCTTTEECELARPYLYGRPEFSVANGVIIPVDDELEECGIVRSKYPVLDEKEIVLFFGRINFKKGLDLLAKAFSLVQKERPNAFLVLAGPIDKGYEGEVRGWLNRAGVDGQYLFTGLLVGPEKRDLLNTSQVFVLPSYSENFGIAVAEAMSYRLPVVVSDRVNIASAISEAGAGLVVPTEERQVATAIIRILSNKLDAGEMGVKGRALVQERYSWDLIGAQLEQKYKEIISISDR